MKGRDEKVQINNEVKLEGKMEDITGITCLYVSVKDFWELWQP
jgi:hypothetical protein